MGQVEEFKRQSFSGAVADRTEITPADGDTFYATDTDQLFIGHGGSWVHQPRFVPRPAVAWDKDINDFTTDGTWKVNGLDLSGVVPVGAVAVALRIRIKDDAADTYFEIRQNAVNTINLMSNRTMVANIHCDLMGIINVDSDRLFDYRGANLVFTEIYVAVVGWWV